MLGPGLYSPPLFPPSTALSTPIVASASFAAPPLYAPPPIVSAGFAGGVYAPPLRVGGGLYSNTILPRPLFDSRGNVIDTTIRNNFYADALSPIIPGIGGAVSFANDVNLISNAPRFINGIYQGAGYRRDPLGTFVRNDFYADALGKFVPGISGSLSAFNKLNLYTSILG
jgi:hypothetical protein